MGYSFSVIVDQIDLLHFKTNWVTQVIMVALDAKISLRNLGDMLLDILYFPVTRACKCS